MSMYCTREQAKSAGATGSDVELDEAIAQASLRVERYTSELFAPVAQTRECFVDGNGVVHVHKRISSITSVSWLGVATPLPVNSYRVSSSSTIGAHDTIELSGAMGWADVTILGAEPWNGGYANLSTSRSNDPRVTIVGVFGWDAPPIDVQGATALLATLARGDDASPETPTLLADSEGNVLPVVPHSHSEQGDRAPLRSRTTGSARADSLLASYVREPVRMRA